MKVNVILTFPVGSAARFPVQVGPDFSFASDAQKVATRMELAEGEYLIVSVERPSIYLEQE
jgi:hypothetical protein